MKAIARRELREWATLAILATGVLFLLARVSATDDGLAWGYLTRSVYDIAIFGLFALGLSLQFGMTGLINLGYAAFAGLGAYTVAIIGARWAGTWVGELEGASPAGVAAVIFFALILGVVLAVPMLVLTQSVWPARFPPRSRHVRTLVGVVPAAVAAVAYLLYALPVSGAGAQHLAAGLAVVVGMLVAALFGVLLGLPTVRLREDYLAIVTIGAAEIMRTFWINEEWLTQGTRGLEMGALPLRDLARGTPWLRDWADGLDVRVVGFTYAIAAVLAVILLFVLLEALQRSPWGRVLNAIREDEEVVAALGKNVLAYKLQALAIGCALAGLAGILWAWEQGSIYPAYFAPALTFNLLIVLVIGGIANHKGAIAGAIAFWGVFKLAGFLPDIAREPLFGAVDAPFLIGLRYTLLVVFALMLAAWWWARRAARMHRPAGRAAALTGRAWYRPSLVGVGVATGLFLVIGWLNDLAAAIERGDVNTSDLAGPPQAIFVGVLLIAIMMWRPEGFVGRREELQHGR